MTEVNQDSINIYRYKFNNEFIVELDNFSKIHQYDHRNDFKDAWNIWVDENDELVNEEVRRLTNNGYQGDILDKMYKSARYYFRKKSTVKKAPTQRRDYIGTNKELLDAMDQHIKNNINQANIKPSIGFIDFCKQEKDVLGNEVDKLFRLGVTDAKEIHDKIKKTYKNRYFILIKG
jgi:hypothetical protein